MVTAITASARRKGGEVGWVTNASSAGQSGVDSLRLRIFAE